MASSAEMPGSGSTTGWVSSPERSSFSSPASSATSWPCLPRSSQPGAPGCEERGRQGQEVADEAGEENEDRSGELTQPVVDPLPGISAELAIDRDVVEVGQQEPGESRHAQDGEDAGDVRQPGPSPPHGRNQPESGND